MRTSPSIPFIVATAMLVVLITVVLIAASLSFGSFEGAWFWLIVVSAGIDVLLIGGLVRLRRSRSGTDTSDKRRGRRILTLGVFAAVFCAATTYYYVSSLFIYPFFLILFVPILLNYRRAASPKRGSAIFGLALSVAALLMPLAAG